eukprot:SAG11_NODE_41391_length_194_cov_92.642105_1_plen_64_part_11
MAPNTGPGSHYERILNDIPFESIIFGNELSVKDDDEDEDPVQQELSYEDSSQAPSGSEEEEEEE